MDACGFRMGAIQCSRQARDSQWSVQPSLCYDTSNNATRVTRVSLLLAALRNRSEHKEVQKARWHADDSVSSSLQHTLLLCYERYIQSSVLLSLIVPPNIHTPKSCDTSPLFTRETYLIASMSHSALMLCNLVHYKRNPNHYSLISYINIIYRILQPK